MQMGTIWAQSTILVPETGLKTTREGFNDMFLYKYMTSTPYKKGSAI